MSEKDAQDRPQDVQRQPDLWVRRSDVFQTGAWTLSLAGFIALCSLLYTIGRNFSRDVQENIEHFETRVVKQVEKLDDRISECCRKGRK